MNLVQNLSYDLVKPKVVQIKTNQKIKYFAVALGKGAVLKKHTAPVAATLLVLQGEIKFVLEGEALQFKQFDSFEIPIGIEHEVTGLSEENLFTIIMEL